MITDYRLTIDEFHSAICNLQSVIINVFHESVIINQK